MSKLGSGDNGEFTFLDIISLLSFCIGIQNLDLNVTQEDAQKLEHELNRNADTILKEIHSHLEEQDRKLNLILEELNNDNRRNIQ